MVVEEESPDKQTHQNCVIMAPGGEKDKNLVTNPNDNNFEDFCDKTLSNASSIADTDLL